uniref:Endonuclease/exonuclease/phosphatase domain-containing protein n=1 Tax=Arcella intermedia TaxID=1963864 RepID=A0A6B2L950_9EUKA
MSPATLYSNCKPEHCDPRMRYQTLLKKLNGHIMNKSIICLQEVAIGWVGPLKTHFSQFGYDFIASNYGRPSNGYMGIAIAYSTEEYNLKDMDVVTVNEGKQWTTPPAPLSWTLLQYCTSALSWLLAKTMNASLTLTPASLGEYESSKERQNRQIMVRLEHRGSQEEFCVATYHVPCLFQFPRTMNIHTALSCQAAQKFAKGGPLVLCGDFNIQPWTSTYRLVTTGRLNDDDKNHPKTVMPAGDHWDPVVQPMRSAYSDFLGEEPPFTNYAQKAGEAPFVGTLDYIFLSEHWKVRGVLPLPKETSAFETPLPAQNEPSDHLLIACELLL